MSKNSNGVDELKNLLDWLISEYEDEKKLRIKYKEALEKIEYMDMDDYSQIISITRKALNE